MKLHPTEIVLTGAWVVDGSRMVADAVCQRIEALVSSHLRLIGRDASGWDTLYQDPADGRLWEHTFPQSQMHGGGPPQLQVICREAALAKYGEQVLRAQ